MSLILDGTNGLSDIDGSAATPAIRGTDANTGIFFGTDIIGFSEGGAEVARFNADSQFVAAAGTAALPVFTTTGDVNTGIFFPAADTIGFAEGGVEAMRIDSSGNVGIGTSSPTGRMEVAATGVPVLRLSSTQTSPNNILMTGGSSYNYGVIGVNTGNNTSTGDIFQLGYTASAGAAPTSVLQWSSAAKCIGLNTNPSTTGTGITFPATQSASTNANTLDDYEEGTWTATLSSCGAGSVANTNYVKVGKIVTARLTISGGTYTLNTSSFTLPFACVGLSSGTFVNGTIRGGFLEPQGSNDCFFATSDSGTVNCAITYITT